MPDSLKHDWRLHYNKIRSNHLIHQKVRNLNYTNSLGFNIQLGVVSVHPKQANILVVSNRNFILRQIPNDASKYIYVVGIGASFYGYRAPFIKKKLIIYTRLHLANMIGCRRN